MGWLLGSVATLALVAAAVAALSDGDPVSPTGDDAPASDVVAITSAADFDPFGSGGEHAEDVPKAYDDDPASAWSTETYNQADLGGLKPGVGVWFTVEDTADVDEVAIDLGVGGVDLEVYAFTGTPSGDQAAWGDPVATAADASGTATLDIPDDVAGPVWLVWLTGLGQDGSGYRAAINDIRFGAG
jgi:putative peptidoglycan lipid II flippase